MCRRLGRGAKTRKQTTGNYTVENETKIYYTVKTKNVSETVSSHPKFNLNRFNS